MVKLFRVSLFVLISLIFSACEPVSTVRPPVIQPPSGTADDILQANRLYKEGRHREAAEAYFVAGQRRGSPESERLILQAAEIAASLPDKNLLQRYLEPMQNRLLSKENRARYGYVAALLSMMNHDPHNALLQLPANVSGLPGGLADKILKTRIRAADATHNFIIMAEERVRQEPYLKNQNALEQNHKTIWEQLGKAPGKQVDLARKQVDSVVLRGWLDLSHLYRISGSSMSTLRDNLSVWQSKYPSHPAFKIARGLVSDQPPVPRPGKGNAGSVAVLLSMKGQMATVGGAILQGIRDAHKMSSSSGVVKSYDISQIDPTVQYNQAVKEGAEFVLGPLSKPRLNSLAQNGHLPVPTIGLNYLDNSQRTPAEMYQYGLSPEDEAVQVAQFATNQNKKIALVLAPDSSWGKRVANAFKSAYGQRGGSIRSDVLYPNRTDSYAALIKRVLAEHDGHFDMVFLAASPTQARMIYPLLRQNGADAVPVYATSHIFSGRPFPANDSSLNGIIYTEIPGVLDAIVSQKPFNGRYPRLHALGMDAYLISRNLSQLKQGSALNGKTGRIRYSSDRKLHRTLEWATFRDGLPTRYGN